MIHKAAFIPTRDLIIFPGIITPLFIGRSKSMATLEKALMEDNTLILCMQKDSKAEEVDLPEGVHEIGVVVNILQTLKMPNGNIKVLVEAKNRVKLKTIIEEEKYFVAEYEKFPEVEINPEIGEALKRKVLFNFEKYGKITNKIVPDLIVNLKGIKSINKVFDLISSNLHISTEKKTKNFR